MTDIDNTEEAVERARLHAQQIKESFLSYETMRTAWAEFREAREWTLLGFDKLADWWNDQKMFDLRIPPEIKPEAAWAFYDDEATPEDVDAMIKGLGLDMAKQWHGEWADGRTPDQASRYLKPNPPEPGDPIVMAFFPKVAQGVGEEWILAELVDGAEDEHAARRVITERMIALVAEYYASLLAGLP